MSRRGLLVRCPAKVNLVLRVLGKRDDGFHELLTLFQAVGLWDELSVEEGSGLELTCDDPSIPTGDDNLVLRAARRLGTERGAEGKGATFRLRKAIPAGGGLGGGSSDAAGALLALDRLWGLALPNDRLAAHAAALGSDVAFFLVGGTAIGTGRGERIRPLASGLDRALILGTPPFPIATSEVYRRLRVPLTPPPDDVTVQRLFTKLVEGKDFGAAVNDLEPVVLEGWPSLASFRAALAESGAKSAMVSGSGSTVFGIFESEHAADGAASELRARFPDWAVRSARTTRSGAHLVGPDRGWQGR